MEPVIAIDADKDNLLEKIVQFEKYAHLLMERFDVKIIFDGTNAFTDGKEIHLPNLLTLTIKEIDLLYGILLHEVGHVRHTLFAGMDSYYERSTTYNQILLSNAIEDARVENKLMQEFGGAKDIFENLYSIFSEDPKYIARIFKMGEKASAEWYHDFCRCVHGHIVKLDFDKAKSIGKNFKKVDALYAGKVEKLVNTMPLKSHADSFELAFAIYDVIFKQMLDKSEKTDFAARAKAKEEAEKIIQEQLDKYNKLVDENKELMNKLKGMRQEKRGLGKEREQFNKEHAPDIEQANKQMAQANDLEYKINSPEYAKSEEDRAQNDLKSAQEALKEVQDKMDAKTAKQDEYAKRAEDSTDKVKEKLKKSIESQERMKESLKQKLEDAKNGVAQAEKYVQRAQDQIQKAQERASKVQLTKEQIEKMWNDAQDTTQKIQEQDQKQYGEKIDKLADKIRQESHKFEQQKEAMEQKLGEQMETIDAKLKEMGLPGISPEFKENPDWKESDGIQQQFDKKATDETGKPVMNGCGQYGTNLRDMVSSLDDISDKLKEINVAEIFSKETHDSLVDSINEMDAPQDNTRASEKGDTFTSARRHIAYTTKFDVVKEQTGGKGAGEVDKIKGKHTRDIAKLTQVLRNKFKFHSKPKFRGAKEEGYLDARELWQIPKGTSEKIFEQIEKKLDSKVQVTVALDISGSMDKEEIGYGDKLKALAVVLSESLNNARVKHEVVGLHAPVCFEMQSGKASTKLYNRTMHNLETVVYRNQGGATGLQNIELQTSDNSDGESLRVVAKRMKKAKKRIIFMVSDCKPFLTDSDIPTLDQDLRNAIRDIKAQGIEVFGIGWNDTGKDFYGDNYVNLTKDIDSLVEFLDKRLVAVR
jgi:myosin heavy subunit